MSIIILGGSGYVGSALQNLISKNRTILETKIYDTLWFGKYLVHGSKITLEKVDIRTGLIEISEGDIVINLAAVSNDIMGNKFNSSTMAINKRASIDMALLAKKRRAACYIYASSASVYGNTGGVRLNEHSFTNPLTTYAKSKLEAESELKKIATPNFKIASLRFSTAAGFSDNFRSDLAINDFVYSAVTKNKITLKSTGDVYRPFISVQDMGKAILKVVENVETLDEYFFIVNVGFDDWNFQIKSVAKDIARILNVDLITESHVQDTRNYLLDFSKWLNFAPDWRPSMSFNELVKEMHLSLVQMQRDGFQQSYVRLDRLNYLIEEGKLDGDLFWKRSNKKPESI